MKIGIISDSHVDINQDYDVLKTLDHVAAQEGCDLVLIAGDIHNNSYQAIESVAALNQFGNIAYRYVPGNHDLWNDHIDLTSTDEIYQLFLQDPNCLCEKPLELTDWVIIGDVGWYDYSFGNHEKYTLADFEKMQMDGRTWQDKIKNCWTSDNLGRTSASLKALEETMARYPHKKKIVVTHMLPIQEFCVDETRLDAQKPDWSYFNAFLGSKQYEALYKKYEVAYAICGHVHYRKNVMKNNTQYLCRCLNYCTEWQGEKEIETQIRKAFDYIEI